MRLCSFGVRLCEISGGSASEGWLCGRFSGVHHSCHNHSHAGERDDQHETTTLYRVPEQLLLLLTAVPCCTAGILRTRASKTPDITYKVQSGDTLDKIANRYGVSATMLAAYNGIANKNIIRKGQTLKIPSDKAKTVTTTVTTTKKTVTTKNTSAPALSGTAYVVKSGDSLGLIAAKHGVKLSALMAANGIKDANKIVTGRKLVIPAGGKAPSVRAPEKKVTTKPAASGTETESL